VFWVPGYFQLVDSALIGNVPTDLNLPDHNTSVDTSYCIQIKSRGFRIGLAPSYLYHTFKSGCWVDMDADKRTRLYLQSKWGDYYFDNIGGYANIVGPVPSQKEPVYFGNFSVDYRVLYFNRAYFIGKQISSRDNAKSNPALRLHLGCGTEIYDGYINIDLGGFPGSVLGDIRNLSAYGDNTVSEIVCQHALEHTERTTFVDTFKEWYRVLCVGGILELGLPDLSLCAMMFSITGELEFENYIYGGRNAEGYLQHHKGGVNMNHLKDMLCSVGFSVEECFNYDGFGTPSIAVFAKKER
jgi:predicted SAM-dependent methyltransferase